ncbi:unnamed protein product [Spirodela intermedia]|uniref:Uncharacterized protein n=1 Tax=Spirodela intermedia TaxID=51605 RepID=A0A7I8IM26_SPIIN|nr:unnamed protein product [Spirodela intermedia]CAA6658204.1 unnamed protein product [Spirodela intermedia]
MQKTIVAIARRRKLLDDGILNALLDDSWDTLDISGSDITDLGLTKAAQTCPNLLLKCKKITIVGVSALISQCHSLEILRCGGCPSSESTARRCLSILVPKLNAVEEESWENLENTDLVDGAQSLRWLVWPNIDPESKARLAVEFPLAACPDSILDESYVAGIDPETWATTVSDADRAGINTLPSASEQGQDLPQLSMAEKFRLAFVERDLRLAPKRAKNMRQRQRRAEKEWVTSSADAKSVVLAAKFRKSL